MKLKLFLSSLAGCAMALVFVCITHAVAQQAGGGYSVNPTASSVREDQLFKQSDRITGRITIPDGREATLIQPEGREWREFHQITLPKYGAYGLIGVLGALLLFFIVRGRVRTSHGESGIKVLRFGGFERLVHWMTAVSFILLGITGLNIVYGRTVLLPMVGPERFTEITLYGKYVHNFIGPVFALGVVLMFVMWVWYNLPSPTDVKWIAEGGGIVGSGHPPAKRFNFGQKLIFWSVVLIGGAISLTGFILLFPFGFGIDIAGMQLAQVVHSVGAVVMIAVILGHIYIGTIGMEGAFDAMGTGKVDLNWAREHHSLWAEKAEVVERPAPAE